MSNIRLKLFKLLFLYVAFSECAILSYAFDNEHTHPLIVDRVVVTDENGGKAASLLITDDVHGGGDFYEEVRTNSALIKQGSIDEDGTFPHGDIVPYRGGWQMHTKQRPCKLTLRGG